MRKAINENRTVQLVLIGVLALAGGLMLLKAQGGGETAAAPADATAPAPTAPATGATPAPATAAAPATSAPATTTAGATPVVSGAGAAAVPASLIPGPGLPKGLLSGYRNGKAIALLVRRAGGIDDAIVRGSVDLLQGLPDVKVYVTKARSIARYAWLTQGVNVTDLPALVLLRPRNLSGGQASASVSYGFRGPGSVLQAAEDALYRGPTDRPYHP
jgi:hypothetical protein